MLARIFSDLVIPMPTSPCGMSPRYWDYGEVSLEWVKGNVRRYSALFSSSCLFFRFEVRDVRGVKWGRLLGCLGSCAGMPQLIDNSCPSRYLPLPPRPFKDVNRHQYHPNLLCLSDRCELCPEFHHLFRNLFIPPPLPVT